LNKSYGFHPLRNPGGEYAGKRKVSSRRGDALRMVPAFALVSRTGGGTSLAVPVLDYAPVLADIGLHRFTSREWLIAMIEDAVTMDSVPDVPRTGRYVLIGAGAGLGRPR
jgi:hypothetical protein